MKILIIIWGILILLNIVGKIYLHYLDHKLNEEIKDFISLEDKDKIQS